MKTQRFIVEIEMPGRDMISPTWLQELIQCDCDVEDKGRQKVLVREYQLFEGLDEAAELEPAIDEYLRIVKETSLRQIARYFAQWGAEWMAKQGIAEEAGVCKLLERAWITPIDEKKFQQDVFDTFAAGDKVIVQIRKVE